MLSSVSENIPSMKYQIRPEFLYIYKEVLFSLCLDIIVVSINPYKQSKDTCILIWGLVQAPKKHFGLRVCSSVIHYIACDGGSFEICNYDIELKKKKIEAMCFFEF